MTRVFISYSIADREFVKRLAEDLQARGLDVWYDSPRLKVGQTWVSEIEKAIRQSQYLIVVLSPAAAKSRWVRREVLYAEELERKQKLAVLPLLLQKCKLPIWSGDRQYIDVQGTNYDLHFDQICQALRVQRAVVTNKIDCMILCGGYAQRLWPLTLDISKVLLPVAGKPVLEYVLDFVQRSKAINKIFLSVNQKYAPQVDEYRKRYLSQRKPNHLIEMIVEDSTEPKTKFGPVGALQYFIKYSGARDLLVLGGDNIFGFPLDTFLDFSQRTGDSCSCNASFENRDRTLDNSEYGNWEIDEAGNPIDLREKPEESTSKYLSSACYFFKKKDLEAITKYMKAGKDRDSIGSFVSWLTDQGQIKIFPFSSYWFDVGTPETLLHANQYHFANSIPRNGRVPDSTFVKPVHIAASASVSESTLGPNVYIGPNVKVTKSTIRDCIIMENCIISGIDIRNCVIGPGSWIKGKLKQSKPIKALVLAPNSRIFKHE